MFVSGLASPVRGILFDLVGTFGYGMLVTTYGGQIYGVNSAGIHKLLASVGEDTEGMDVAPLGGSFGPFNGQLVVMSEVSGLLRAVSPKGVVTVLNASNPIVGSERVTFVPLDLGKSGSTLEGLYEANYATNVLKADGKQFEPYKGDAIVSTELGDRRISRVHWNGASFDITVIGHFPSEAEDGVFLSPTMLNPGCPVSQDSRPSAVTNWCWPNCGKWRGRPRIDLSQ